MVIYKQGNINSATEKIICNLVGVEKGPNIGYENIRLLITKKWEMICKSYIYNFAYLQGKNQIIHINNNQVISNSFVLDQNSLLNIKYVKHCFKKLVKLAIKKEQAIAIPYKFNLKLNNEKWEEIINLINEISGLVKVFIYKEDMEENMEQELFLNREEIEERVNPVTTHIDVVPKTGKKQNNSLDKLNDVLFNQIDKIVNAKDPGEVQQEISKSYAISHMSQRIINNANVYLKALELSDKKGLKDSDMPEVLKIDNE